MFGPHNISQYLFIITILTSSFAILCKNVVIFPSRTAAIENALRLFSPRLAVVDENLTRHLPRLWLTSSALEVWNRHAFVFFELDYHFVVFVLLSQCVEETQLCEQLSSLL